MRVSIDWDMCAGAGLCARAAPRVFEVIDLGDGRRRAVLTAPGSDAQLTAAAFACPTLAITILDATGRPLYPAPSDDPRTGR
ncbi:MAG: ferredoxin [Ardenticatenales bacterium]